MNKKEYSVGDLVVITGFEKDIWKVIARSKRKERVYYEMHSIYTGNIRIVEHKFIRLVSKSEHSSKFLEYMDGGGSVNDILLFNGLCVNDILDHISKVLSVKHILGELTENLENDLKECYQTLRVISFIA